MNLCKKVTGKKFLEIKTLAKKSQFSEVIEKNVSGAEGIADPSISNLVPLDLNGTPRNDPADAGAYQSTEFPPEG